MERNIPLAFKKIGALVTDSLPGWKERQNAAVVREKTE